MTTADTPNLALRWAKRLFMSLLALLSLLLILALIGLFLAPGLGLYAANKWYSQQGEGYQLEAKSWQFSPFRLSLELDEVQLVHPQVGAGRTELKQVRLQLDPWRLLDRSLQIQHIELSGLNLALQLTQQTALHSVQIAGLTILLSAAENAAENTVESAVEPPVVEPESAVEPWLLELHSLRLKDFQVAWQIALEEQQLAGQVHLSELRVQDFSSAENSQPYLAVALTLPQLQVNAPELTLLAPLQIEAQGRLETLQTNPTWQGQLSINNLALAQEDLVVRLASVVLNGMRINAQQQSLAQLTVQELALDADQHPLFKLASYQLEGLQVQQNERLSVDLGSHQYQGLEINIERTAEGGLAGFAATAPVEATAQSEPESELEPETIAPEAIATAPSSAEAAQVIVIALAHWLQQNAEQQHSLIHIVDNSVSPRLKTQVGIKQFEIGPVQSQITDSKLALNAAVPIELALSVGDSGSVHIKADLSVYEDAGQWYPEGQIKVQVRRLDIVDFNGYLIDAIGYQLNHGSLDLDADITIQQMQLSGEVKLLLRNSSFVPADEAVMERISKQISMPVDTAIGLLRDKNGNVSLTIPLEGRLDDPDFGIGDVTRQLTNKALRTATLFFLRQSLQPYGTMLSLASLTSDYLFAIRLDALQYATDEVSLSEDHQANLHKVGELMTSKERIEVKACPFVSAEEALQHGEEWPELGRRRGLEVQRWFNEHFPQQSARLTLCRAQQGSQAEVVLGVN